MSDREALIDALVMSPMSDTVGTDMSRISRTADEILSSEWLRQHDAEVWAEGFNAGHQAGYECVGADCPEAACLGEAKILLLENRQVSGGDE